MGSLNHQSTWPFTAMRSLPFCFLVSLAITCAGADPPATRQEVSEVIQESKAKKNPALLHKLKGAPLDMLLPGLRELWMTGEGITESWISSRNAGKEKEFLEMETSVNRDPNYLSEAYPIARELLIGHPDFEWTMQTKLGRMTFILNEAQRKMTNGEHPGPEYADINSSYPYDLGFARRIPGDAALRIVGPCLFSPYYPVQDHGDTTVGSPAGWARGTLSQLLKERYGEDLPKDIEAARAWWKANENRFAAKEAAAPKSPNPSKIAPKKDSPTDSQNKAASSQATDSPPASEVTSRKIHWSIPVAIVSAFLAAVAWFLRKKG